jgi:hypothetical protein
MSRNNPTNERAQPDSSKKHGVSAGHTPKTKANATQYLAEM